MAQFARPDADISKGNWVEVPASGPNDLWDKIDETSPDDNDYIQDTVNNDTCEIRLSDVSDPLYYSGHWIRVRHRLMAGTFDAGLTIALMCGTTQIFSVAIASLGATWTTYEYELDGESAASITDYTDLRYKFTSTGIDTDEGVEISWAEFEVPNVADSVIEVSDSGSGTETLAITAQIEMSDSGAGSESTQIGVSFTITDSALGIDLIIGPFAIPVDSVERMASFVILFEEDDEDNE